MKLLITEKKKQCEDLAKAMKWKLDSGCFKGTFENEELIATWASGHLLRLKAPDELVDGLTWDSVELLNPITRRYELRPGDDIPGAHINAQPKTYLKRIKSFIGKASEVIIATDSDREGEAIGWYILNYFNYKGKSRRAWFSAGLDVKSLTDAMNNLRPSSDTKPWFYAAESRGRSDLAYMYLVRAYTFYAQRDKFGSVLNQGNGRSSVVSVGRVQTPTLRMIVDRENEIINFVSVDHFKISGNFGFNNNDLVLTGDYKPKVTRDIIDSEPMGVSWQESKVIPKEGEPEPLETPLFTGKREVDDFKKRLLEKQNEAIVSSYREGTRRENPPKTFSLTDAQTAIAKKARISANLAQVILEDLYEQGWTSYARTSKSDLPINFYEQSELNGLLRSLSDLPEIQNQAKEAKSIHKGEHSKYSKFVPPVFTKKDLEHHGIVPTHQVMSHDAFNSLTPKKLSDGGKVNHTKNHMQMAYILIAKQFIQALYPAAEYKTQKIEFILPVVDILGNNESKFFAKGEKIVELGWRSAFSGEGKKNITYPSLSNGTNSVLKEVLLSSSRTTPPSRYTEITLPKEMEKVSKFIKDPELRKLLRDAEGIGTPATRKNVIETLIVRNYIEVKKGAYYPTKKGFALIKTVPDWLSSVETTATWENYLSEICEEKNLKKAESMRDQFVNKQTDKVEDLIASMISEFGSNLKKVSTGGYPSKVTDNMKKTIRNISKYKNIPVPRGTLSDPKKASEFLNEHIDKKDDNKSSSEPTSGQLSYLKRLIKDNPGSEIPNDAYTNKKVCSDLIDKLTKITPPSEKQLNYAKSIRENVPSAEKAWSPEIEKSGKLCSEFINKFRGKMNNSGKKTFKKRSTTATF